MAGARWAALAVMGAIAIGVVGCGGDDGPTGTNIAAFTPGSRDDADWTRQTTDAIERVAKGYGVRAVAVDGTPDGSARAALTRLARDAQLLIAPFAADRAAAVQVAESTKVPTLVWGDPKALRPGLVGDVEVDFVNALFTAGAIAVKSARDRSVAIVMCDDSSAWDAPERYALAAAFVKGARAMDPKARAGYGIAGNDEASAEDVTVAVAEQGQIILDLCGTAAPGVLKGMDTAAEKVNGEAMMVSLVGDKGTINKANIIMGGVIVNPAVAFEAALRDIRADRFGERVYTLNQANRGITQLQTGRTPSDAYEEGLKLKPPPDLPTTSDEATLDEVIAE